MMERYQLDEARDPRLLSGGTMAGTMAAAAHAADVKATATRAAERRSKARPWSARNSAPPTSANLANTAKAAVPMSGFTKIADDDTDWKEF